MNTVVIGAKGFVGGYLVKELESAGHKVTAVDIPEVNLLDRDSVDALLESAKPNYVVNLAAISSVGASWKDPVSTIQVNVVGTLNLLESIAKNCPNAKTLLIGSAEEYAQKDTPLSESCDREASNPYGISKIAQENFAELYRKKYGMKIVCTRSFNHTGVGQKTTFALPSFVQQVATIEKAGCPAPSRSETSAPGATFQTCATWCMSIACCWKTKPNTMSTMWVPELRIRSATCWTPSSDSLPSKST